MENGSEEPWGLEVINIPEEEYRKAAEEERRWPELPDPCPTCGGSDCICELIDVVKSDWYACYALDDSIDERGLGAPYRQRATAEADCRRHGWAFVGENVTFCETGKGTPEALMTRYYRLGESEPVQESYGE